MISKTNIEQSDQQGSEEIGEPAGIRGTHSHQVRRAGASVGVVGLVVAASLALVGSFGSTSSANTTRQPAVVSVTVTSPTSGSVVAVDHVTIRGTVSPADAAVQVQGRPAAVGNGVFTASASLHGGKTTVDVVASAPGAAPDATSVVVVRQAPAHNGAPRPAGGESGGTSLPRSPYNGSPPAAYEPAQGYVAPGYGYDGQGNCGDGLSVGPNTTCPFAENVRSAYESHGPGAVIAYSPVTNLTYTMSCSTGAPVVCTGGNDATVYFP